MHFFALLKKNELSFSRFIVLPQNIYLFINLVKSVLRGHPWDKDKVAS
jgi:hypothetical protein